MVSADKARFHGDKSMTTEHKRSHPDKIQSATVLFC